MFWCSQTGLCYFVSKSSNDCNKILTGKRSNMQVKPSEQWYVGQLELLPLSTAIGL